MPRLYLSSWDAYISRKHRQIDNMSTQQLRIALKSILEHTYEVQNSWSHFTGLPDDADDEEDTLTISGYLDTAIHNMIVEGLATRVIVEACINHTSSQTSETAIVMLVELGHDLILHQARWSPTDLDYLHSRIQEALLGELKEDVWVEAETCKRMDELAMDVRYKLLAAKLEEDRGILESRDWTEHDKWVDRSAERSGAEGSRGDQRAGSTRRI